MRSDKETHCAHVYFCPSRSNLVSSAHVHNSSRAIVRLWGRFTALILPHLLPCLAHTLQVFAAQGSQSRLLHSLQRPEATSVVQFQKQIKEFKDMMLILHKHVHHGRYTIHCLILQSKVKCHNPLDCLGLLNKYFSLESFISLNFPRFNSTPSDEMEHI